MAEHEHEQQHEHGPKMPAVLSRRVGPLPIIGWAGVAAGGLVLGLLLRRTIARRQLSAATDNVTAESVAAQLVPSAAPILSGQAAPSGAVSGSAPSDGGGSNPRRPTTNWEWQQQATELLLGMGQNPAAVTMALGKYLGGSPLTAAEKSIVSLAIRYLGLPPEGAPPIIDAPTPTQQPATPPPSPPSGPATPAPTPAAGGIVDAYPGADNATVIQTAEDKIYRNDNADLGALRDTLAVRMRDGKLCANSLEWWPSRDPTQPPMVIREHALARMAGLGWRPKC